MEKDDLIMSLRMSLEELVNLKDLKDKDGKTDDYLKRQPLAWSNAKRLLQMTKSFGVRADNNNGNKGNDSIKIN